MFNEQSIFVLFITLMLDFANLMQSNYKSLIALGYQVASHRYPAQG